MHVCHFCDSSLEGDYFRNITFGLENKGVRVSLIQLTPGTPPTWLPPDSEARFVSLNVIGKRDYPGAVLRLRAYLKAEKVDILHTHLFYSGLLGVLAKRLHRRTIVALMRHHTGVVRMLGSASHVRLDRWMAEKADRLLTVSNAARDYMRNVDGIKRDIDVVHLGFDFQRLRPDREGRSRIRHEFGFGENDFIIGYVANFASGKGHAQLVKAFDRIAAEIPDAKLLLVGKGTRPEVEKAREMHPGKIIMAGWRSDIPACLNAMDIFVQPSLSEAFSQVIIEAMGVGLPVIATDVGGAREAIDDGVNGLVIPPDDSEAISLSVFRLFENSSLRQELSRCAMETARQRFSAEQMVERQYELYRSYLGKA